MELPQRAELIPQVRTELELQAYLGRARSFATTHLRAREFPVEDERVTGEGGRGGEGRDRVPLGSCPVSTSASPSSFSFPPLSEGKIPELAARELCR